MWNEEEQAEINAGAGSAPVRKALVSPYLALVTLDTPLNLSSVPRLARPREHSEGEVDDGEPGFSDGEDTSQCLGNITTCHKLAGWPIFNRKRKDELIGILHGQAGMVLFMPDQTKSLKRNVVSFFKKDWSAWNDLVSGTDQASQVIRKYVMDSLKNESKKNKMLKRKLTAMSKASDNISFVST